MRGTTLADLRKMLKAEIGDALQGSMPQDTALNVLIDNKQKLLAGERDWPFLATKSDVSVSAQTATLPSTINFERPVKVEVYWTNHWIELFYGIGADEYNAWDTETVDPIRKWMMKDDGTFEVWPLPLTAQSVRFWGQRQVNTLYDDTSTLELDDLLVMLYCAADKTLKLKSQKSQVLLAAAQARLRTLLGAYPKKGQDIVFGSRDANAPLRRDVYVTVAHS